ncbi:MAG: flagellar biosynthetic protein FliO, partial [Rubrivivax sp.]
PAMLPGVPRTVASLTLSGQQRVVTVEVGSGDARTWLVLGVSPQGIQTLHALPMAALPVIDTASAGATTGPGPHLATAAFGSQPSPVTPVAMPPFAQMLSRVLKHHRHAPR